MEPEWPSRPSSRRRSSAAVTRPAAPPPSHPIPSVPASPPPPPSVPMRPPRPALSPNLSAVAAFSQARYAAHNDDLEDPPPSAYLAPSQQRHQDRNRLGPPVDNGRRPSSRRALTRALELAREAVKLDSTNDNPEAAVQAYAQSVALLSEVMERVRNGEESTESTVSSNGRRRRRRSVAAQEEEVRRLQNIHDTYADRMNILSLIYSIPTIPYTSSAAYAAVSNSNTADSTTDNSPTTSPSPSTDNSPRIVHQHFTPFISDDTVVSDDNAVYLLDESVLTGTAVTDLHASHHPYSVQYEQEPQLQTRNSIMSRRRAPPSLPPKHPPPADSLPEPPIGIAYEPPLETPTVSRRQESLQPHPTNHRRTGSNGGLSALEEESYDFPSAPSAAVRRESPPLPPLPAPPPVPEPRAFKAPPSPRLASAALSRPRGSSQLTTRTEMANVPQMSATSHGTIMQRRNKTSAPSSPRSASPVESTASAGSPTRPTVPIPSMPTGRLRSSSQPGRRPSLLSGRASPEQLPPMPHTNGILRKVSVPSKLNPTQNVQTDSQAMQQTALYTPGLISSRELPATPTSPLPPMPPTDASLQPYHFMTLLRNTMTSSTGGYVSRRLHVPCEVWSQGGAKLSNLDEKIRVVTILVSALDDLQTASAESFGAGNVASGMGVGIGAIGRREADIWLAKLEDFSNMCDSVVANYGKKLGVGEGFVSRKTTWGDKWTRRLDKFTNGKNLDSPASYVQGLKRLFLHAQLLDEHTRAIISTPVAPIYAAFPIDLRVSAEQKLKRFSDFFASVVLTFVMRDLSQLLDKYVKKLEKWLAE